MVNGRTDLPLNRDGKWNSTSGHSRFTIHHLPFTIHQLPSKKAMPCHFSRRSFIKSAGLLLLSRTLGTEAMSHVKRKELLLYVGTYTSGKSEGIYLYRMDLSSGELRHLSTAKGVLNPSFLAIDRKRRHLYAVNEETEF